VQDAFASIDPSRIISKIKLHLLAHAKDDVRACGPLVGAATEVYESFNAVFRSCSILSNHLAPSRDIAAQLAGQEAFKHLLLGSWWPKQHLSDNVDPDDCEWVRAGPGVCDYLRTRPVIRALVGCAQPKALIPGWMLCLFITVSIDH
jgi:hypothetical protein